MAWKVCWPEHSLHMAVVTQILELEITTIIYMNHGECNDKLQIQDLLSDYGKYCEQKTHALTGRRDTNNSTKLTDLHSLGGQHWLELWYSHHPVPQVQYKIVTESKCLLSEQKCHTSLICFAWLPQGFWGHLSLA